MVKGTDLFFILFNNLAIFVALAALYGNFLPFFEKRSFLSRKAAVGVLFGLFAIGCMYAKIPVHQGVIVDQRNAIVVLSGVYGGPIPALISALMAGSYRLYLGGGGAIAGFIGVFLAATAGILLNRTIGRFDTVLKAVGGSLFAAVFVLPGFLFVDDFHTSLKLMKAMALPYGGAIFSGIFLVGILLNRQTQVFNIEKRLRKSEEKYREVVEGTSDLIMYVDDQGRFTYVNRVGEEIYGIPPEQLVNVPAFDFVHPDDKEKTSQRFKDCAASRRPKTVLENRVVNRLTGDAYTMLWTVNFNFNRHGKMLGASAIAHDITERQKTEERIHIFNDLINQSNDAILVIDAVTAQVLEVNLTACSNFGYSKEEVLQMKITEILEYLSEERVWKENYLTLKKEKSLLIEELYERKNGTKIPLEINMSLSRYKGNEYIVAVARDLTERKVLQSRLSQAQKMEAIGRLAGGIAHDLNNMLIPVIGYSELLMLEPGISDNYMSSLKGIAKAGEGARDLVRQLLAFGRKQVLEYRVLDLSQVVEGFENLLRRTIREDIELRCIKSFRHEAGKCGYQSDPAGAYEPGC